MKLDGVWLVMSDSCSWVTWEGLQNIIRGGLDITSCSLFADEDSAKSASDRLKMIERIGHYVQHAFGQNLAADS